MEFGLLGAALVLFWLSTRQFNLLVRVAIWAVAAAALAGAVYVVVRSPDHYGLIAFIADAVTRWDGSVLAEASRRNWPAVEGAALPMFDAFVIVAALLGLVCLIALTPGDFLEKLTRPVILLLIGAMGGAFFALFVIASGLGGYVRDRSYAAEAGEVTVIDGDTIRIGETSLRLAGIDAPEYHAPRADGRAHRLTQHCFTPAGARLECGEAAKAALEELVADAVVYCTAPSWEMSSAERAGALREALGRPVVQCWSYRNDEPPRDLARVLATNGAVDVYRSAADDEGSGPYGCAVRDAIAAHQGMWTGRTLSPWDWRNNDDARVELDAGGDPFYATACARAETPP